MQRAVKDLSIEQSLKTYEEVWLSKIFEVREHVRNKAIMSQQKAEKEAGNTGQGDPAAAVCKEHFENLNYFSLVYLWKFAGGH